MVGLARRTTELLLLGALLAWAGAALVQGRLEALRKGPALAERLRYLPSGEALRFFSLGYEQLLADLLWLQTVQYIGSTRTFPPGDRTLYNLAETVTTLDPNYVSPYVASGGILAAFAHQYEESNRILRKAIDQLGDDLKRDPMGWWVPFFLGFNHFFYLNDPAQAGAYYAMAAEMPGSPGYLPRLAAKLLAEGGDMEEAIAFLQRIVEESPDPVTTEIFGEALKDLVTRQHLEGLRAAARAFVARAGRHPRSLHELVRAGLLREIPPHPRGGRYRLDPVTGEPESVLPGGR
ncbi:MAG: tetratricopeptide repeat protein [Deltaproteobacteria bacterium]|nr:tetratricopeptide repeat protein [Deltaproteobacteria bacterium]MBI3077399.1 tetratricopeptide repeat protein [Deltaproteobacteria bacterium]